jgi:hypothetical protein
MRYTNYLCHARFNKPYHMLSVVFGGSCALHKNQHTEKSVYVAILGKMCLSVRRSAYIK